MNRYFYILISLAAAAIITSACGEAGKKYPAGTDKAVVYELSIRQFTEEGTLSKAAERLSHLKALGISMIVLAPVQPIGFENRLGELGNAYTIRNYTSVNPDLGSMEDFRAFTDEARRLGFKVILDWVGSYTARDAEWTDKDGWYVTEEDGTLVAPEEHMDGALLNYADMDMRDEMLRCMHFWLREGGVDGFRCCFAKEVPVDFWAHSAAQLRNERQELVMITDTDFDDPHSTPFDISTSRRLYAVMRSIANGKENAEAIRRYIGTIEDNEILRMGFTSNHEENEWNGTGQERFGDAVKCFAALTYILPDLPMISNGQEVGASQRISNLVHDPIDWRNSEKREFLRLYRVLNVLKRSNSALFAGQGKIELLPNSHERSVLSLVRRAGGDKCVALFNLSSERVEAVVELGPENSGDLIDVFKSSLVPIESSQTVSMAPWEFIILSNC